MVAQAVVTAPPPQPHPSTRLRRNPKSTGPCTKRLLNQRSAITESLNSHLRRVERPSRPSGKPALHLVRCHARDVELHLDDTM